MRFLRFFKNRYFLSVFLGTVFVYFSLLFYVAQFVYPPEVAGTHDAALVLGAKSYKGGIYNPCLIARVDTGITLYKNHHVPVIIFSGGTDGEDGVNEAETMQKIALENGVSLSDIILEKESTSTYENLINSTKILQGSKHNSIVIVSEPFHIARIRLIARTLGINATYLSAQDSPCWTRWKYLSRYFMKEPLSIMYYLATGKIKITSFYEN